MRKFLTDVVDPRPLALCRILVGLAALWFSFEWVLVLVRASSGQYLAMPVFEGWPSLGPDFVWALFLVSSIASIAMIIGIAGRLPAIMVAASAAVVLLVEQQSFSNHMVLLMMLAAFLGASGCASAWRVSRSPRATAVPYWPVFLIQVQITTLYAWTAISKVNPQYLSGEVLSTFLQPWVSLSDELLPFAALVSIVAEAFLAVALWIPKLRMLAFSVGAGLHLGIVLLLDSPAPLVGFGMLMLTGYVLFGWAGARSTLLGARRLKQTSPPAP